MFSLLDKTKRRIYVFAEPVGIYVREVPNERDLSQVKIAADQLGKVVLFESTQLECECFIDELYQSLMSMKGDSIENLARMAQVNAERTRANFAENSEVDE